MNASHRHFRMLVALCLGAVLAGLAVGFDFGRLTIALFGINGFFTGYLVLTLWLTWNSTADDLRNRAPW